MAQVQKGKTVGSQTRFEYRGHEVIAHRDGSAKHVRYKLYADGEAEPFETVYQLKDAEDRIRRNFMTEAERELESIAIKVARELLESLSEIRLGDARQLACRDELSPEGLERLTTAVHTAEKRLELLAGVATADELVRYVGIELTEDGRWDTTVEEYWIIDYLSRYGNGEKREPVVVKAGDRESRAKYVEVLRSHGLGSLAQDERRELYRSGELDGIVLYINDPADRWDSDDMVFGGLSTSRTGLFRNGDPKALLRQGRDQITGVVTKQYSAAVALHNRLRLANG